jgi:hypothetical protein
MTYNEYVKLWNKSAKNYPNVPVIKPVKKDYEL